MKKIIALLLVLVIAFSITACDGSDNKGENTYKYGETLPLDVEELKANWKDGELVFANKKSIKLPCKAEEFVSASDLKVNGGESVVLLTLAPDETKSLYLVDDGTSIEITCKNTTDEDINIMEATVVEYYFTNVKPGNRKIKFVGTLTAGVTRADVEKALELPKNATSEDVLYFYKGRNSANKKVELRVSFNSDNVVNSVAFKVTV